MKIFLRRRHALRVEDCAFSHKIYLLELLRRFLISKHLNPITGSKVTPILLNGWILPIGEASAVKGLQSTGLPHLVLHYIFKTTLFVYCSQNTRIYMHIVSNTLQHSNTRANTRPSECRRNGKSGWVFVVWRK